MPRGKLTAEVQATIVVALRAGAHLDTACEAAGIPKHLCHEWLKRGRGEHRRRKATPLYEEFADAVYRAIYQSEVHALEVLQQGEKDWRAAAWWLERRFPTRWGKSPVASSEGEAQELRVVIEYVDVNPKTPAPASRPSRHPERSDPL